MGILDKYKEQLEKDRKNENVSFPEGSQLKEEQREEYVKALKELRNNSNDMENIYHAKMAEMKKMSENDMESNKLISDETVEKVIVKHAYCEECGEELISNAPPMFNPFTFERVCKHTCTKCGKIYNLEFAYPRLAFINNKGEEIPAFTR
jgi:formylmethanofuran dehydrogenase subunit E